jgi:gliding motility-associated-like protein
MLFSRVARKSLPLFFLFILLIGFTTDLQAQLCTGSLGDPVVNITFGDGNTNTGGYVPTSGYSFTSSSCPDDGYYTITSSTSNCFGGAWHTVNGDHTGNGAFLLVNASYTPGDFLVTTVTDLCPNTKYEFAAWMINVLKFVGIKPNITFTIETPTGTVLQRYATGDIPETFPTALWKQYGFFFTTPVNNPVIVLRMTNNAPGGNGNDIGIDDITFRPCGPIIRSNIQGSSDTVDICEGNSNRYTIQSNVSAGYISPAYQWQISKDSGKTWIDIAGATTLNYLRQPSTVGRYWYRLAVTEQTAVNILSCRIASNNVIINVHAKPLVTAGADRIMFLGDSIKLDGQVTGENPNYYWDPPDFLNDKTLLDASATPTSDKTYTLLAETPFGCKNQDVMSFKVVADVFVPTAFTPNGDNKNDHWRIPFLDPILGANVNVYNRFGQLVYTVDSGIVDWDGTSNGVAQSPGVYVYQIRFKKNRKDLKGTFVLIK